VSPGKLRRIELVSVQEREKDRQTERKHFTTDDGVILVSLGLSTAVRRLKDLYEL